jgi:NACalpha-BTF3-like transcription factor
MSKEKDNSSNVVDISGAFYTEQHEKIIKYVCSNTNLTRNQAIHGLQMLNGDYKKVIQIATANHLIEVVMRQTTYTREEAIEKLKKFKGEPVDVIREFMGIEVKSKNTPKTTNQMIFSEIRNFMDDVNKGYNERKTRNEKINKLRQKIMNNSN